MNNYFIFGIEYGSVADWTGVFLTTLTIFFSIRYYSNDNRKNLKLYVRKPIKKTTSNENVYIYENPSELIISCYNSGKVPILLELRGIIALKTTLLHRIWRRISNQKFIPSCMKFNYEKNMYPITFSLGEREGDEVITTISPYEMKIIYTCKLDTLYNFINKLSIKINKNEELYFYFREIEEQYYYVKLNA